MKTKTYNVYADPSHAWVKVRIAELDKLGISRYISEFSYVRGDYAYLEEDQDASILIDELERQRISQKDKELNEIYEKAADAMNLIEEHGYKVDLSKENLGIEEEVCGEMYCSSDLSLSGSDLTYSPSSAGITYIPGLYTLDDLVSDSGISSASQSYN